MENGNRPRVLVLSAPGDVERARDDATWLGRERLDHVLVALPGVGEPTRTELARRVRRHTNDCGCRAGELVALLTVLVLWLGPFSPGVLPGLGLVLGAAVAGKLAGLAVSRQLLRADLRRLDAAAREHGRREHRGGGHHGLDRVS
jgi:hypothetical protein